MSISDTGVLVLADDLSGAAEAAVTLGTAVRIILSSPDPDDYSLEIGADSSSDVAVDLDCRYVSPAAAASRTRNALASPGHEERFTVIKIDSLLRGNIAAHLSAALDRSSGPVLFAPALPQQNRTVVDGVPLVDGIRLDETTAWDVEDGSAPTHLRDLCPEPPAHLDLRRLRTNEPQELASRFRAARLVTADAETMDDLRRVVALAESVGALVVGSAAAVRAFADIRSSRPIPPTGSSPSQARVDQPGTSELPILFAVGTAADRIDDQLDHLRTQAKVDVFDFPATEVAAWGDDAMALSSAAERVRQRLTTAHLVVRLTDTGESVDARPLPGLLAELVAQSLTGFGPAHLAATGGETARAVLDRLGVRALDTIREIHPGAVLSQVPTTSARSGARTELCRVVTRPGGQGDESSLTLIHEALSQSTPVQPHHREPQPPPRTFSRTTKENE
ncbi:four-carbon acid sugar kinase family protein [Brevibacterium marinum]|uniref:4-hydroxythreonine-4-phosphate dehydrogenase n=1 Tax=Brevibacterium marinum TaxID=418643 RepID=A0A846RZ35_9MICO|nr:four-carbon acid sugar kinase family protein [Brevibacterium marinum]NJC55221.1 4-hydroxythreonine-4-phosphate dehydrogenase [Brevibacterium marinum]